MIVNIEPEKQSDYHEEKYGKEISTRAFIATLVAGALAGAAVAAFTGYIDKKIAENNQIPNLNRSINQTTPETK